MKVMFICTGNMTRSPLAEGILRRKLAEAGITCVEVTSAGTGATDGLDRDRMMLEVAAEAGYEISGKTRRADSMSAIGSDLILCMEPHHVSYMKGIIPHSYHHRIHLLMKWALGSSEVVYDPTCRPKDFYMSVLADLERACEAITQKIDRQ